MNSIYYEGDPPTSGIPDDLSQGNGQEELDFRHLFLYNPPGNDEDEQGWCGLHFYEVRRTSA